MIIYKYKLPSEHGNIRRIELPADAKIIHLGICPKGNASMWVLLDPEKEKVGRMFINIWTGFNFPNQGEIYLGSVKQNSFMHHIFEVLK